MQDRRSEGWTMKVQNVVVMLGRKVLLLGLVREFSDWVLVQYSGTSDIGSFHGRTNWESRSSSSAQLFWVRANFLCLRDRICWRTLSNLNKQPYLEVYLTSSKSSNLSRQFSQYPGLGSLFSAAFLRGALITATRF
jgi:hypothetical protein